MRGFQHAPTRGGCLGSATWMIDIWRLPRELVQFFLEELSLFDKEHKMRAHVIAFRRFKE
jgi:hypothetical protein